MSALPAKGFESYARDYMQLACQTKDDASREELINIARLWMGLAMNEDAADGRTTRCATSKQP
jgi:hypothetical protein